MVNKFRVDINIDFCEQCYNQVTKQNIYLQIINFIALSMNDLVYLLFRFYATPPSAYIRGWIIYAKLFARLMQLVWIDIWVCDMIRYCCARCSMSICNYLGDRMLFSVWLVCKSITHQQFHLLHVLNEQWLTRLCFHILFKCRQYTTTSLVY